MTMTTAVPVTIDIISQFIVLILSIEFFQTRNYSIYKYRIIELTISISNLALVLESSSHSNAKNHEYPIDIWNVYLAKEFL